MIALTPLQGPLVQLQSACANEAPQASGNSQKASQNQWGLIFRQSWHTTGTAGDSAQGVLKVFLDEQLFGGTQAEC